MNFRAENQCSQEEIGQGKNHIEIFVHVTVMQQVMTIQAEEDARTFHMPTLRQVHAPMHVFIPGIIERTGNRGTAEQTPFLKENSESEEWHLAASHEYWPVPPGHRDGVFIILVDEMIGMVSPEYPVMNQSMPLKRITEIQGGLVHEITMQEPFEERGENDTTDETNAHPKNKRHNYTKLFD